MRPAIVSRDDPKKLTDVRFCVGIGKASALMGSYHLIKYFNAGSLAHKPLVRVEVGKYPIVNVVKRKTLSLIERSLVVQGVLES